MPDKFELVSDVLTDRDVPTLTVRRQGISEPPHVIVLHGLYSRKEEYLYELYLLAMAGFSATAIDMALHGDRPGSAGLADRMASDYLGAIQSVIYETVADICGLLDLWKVRVHSTGLFAISAGGLAAHAVSVVDKRIGAVAALITSPDWLTADPKMNLPSGSPVELVLSSMSPSNKPAAYPPKALLMMVGDNDDILSPLGAKMLYKKLLPLYRSLQIEDRLKLVVYPEQGHLYTSEMREQSVRWLERNLLKKDT